MPGRIINDTTSPERVLGEGGVADAAKNLVDVIAVTEGLASRAKEKAMAEVANLSQASTAMSALNHSSQSQAIGSPDVPSSCRFEKGLIELAPCGRGSHNRDSSQGFHPRNGFPTKDLKVGIVVHHPLQEPNGGVTVG